MSDCIEQLNWVTKSSEDSHRKDATISLKHIQNRQLESISPLANVLPIFSLSNEDSDEI